MRSRILYIPIFILSCAFCFVKPENWKATEKYDISAGSGADGGGIKFKGLKAFINFDEEDCTRSKIMATIDANTLSAGNKEMTEHTKEAIDAKNFPEISFKSTAIAKTAKGYEATGDLTLKGITKEIKFPFDFDSKKDIVKFPFVPKQTFVAKMLIKPKDFGITRAGTPEQLFIDISVPVIK
jgi:polyisoprenoid-binding protein YceI